MSNRRQFVATTLGAGALLGGMAPAFATQATRVADGGFPSKTQFESLQGQALEVHAAGRARATLDLVAVSDHACCQRIEQFSLLLRGSPEDLLSSDIYGFALPDSGRFQLRLEPSGEDARGALYRADITRFS